MVIYSICMCWFVLYCEVFECAVMYCLFRFMPVCVVVIYLGLFCLCMFVVFCLGMFLSLGGCDL